MNFLLKKIKNYPVSVTYIIAIWVLCLMDVPESPLSHVRFIDKWTHIVMYLGTCLTIWIEYKRNHVHIQWLRLLLWAWLAPALMSGLIEIIQATCTGGRRSGEWMDFYANTLGCTLAAIIGAVLAKRINRSHKVG